MTKTQRVVYNILITKLPLKSVCAIMGNISAESAWNAQAIEKGNSIGFGLCQWSFGRRKALEQFGTDIESQARFILYELETNQYIEKKGYLSRNNFMNGNGTVADLAAAFCFCWERPNKLFAHLDRRVAAAEVFYKQLLPYSIYYPKYAGNSNSIVAALKELSIDSSYQHRKEIALANQIAGYQGSAAQNTHLLKLLRLGLLIKE